MHPDAIHAWIQTIVISSPPHDPLPDIDDASLNKAKCRSTRYSVSSPSKQYRKMADLLTLDRPVHFKMETDMETALPSNVQDLYDALVMAEHSEGILPPTLADDPSMNSRNIRPYMWQQADKTADTQSTRTSTQPSDRSVADKHRRMLELVKLSNESFDLHRSEAAWNTIVHYPLLSELTSFSSVRVEPITSA